MEFSLSRKNIGADLRFPISFYFRVANQIVDQAKVHRDAGNVDELYRTLTRYSRLLSETIPQHPSYLTYSTEEKLDHKKILQEFVKELETLKPLIGRKINATKRGKTEKSKNSRNDVHLTSHRQTEKDHTFSSNNESRVKGCGLVDTKSHSVESSIQAETIGLASVITFDARTSCKPLECHCSTYSTREGDQDINVHIVKHFPVSPVISCIQSVPHEAHVSHITSGDSRNGHLKSSHDESLTSKAIQDVHISVRLMEDFLELARANTDNNLETCGVLGAFLKNQIFYVTTLIVPKQESTSSSCQALNEEEIYAIQEAQSLFPVGWIHTHPSQTCFMSSIDLHTHYSYQVMLPEAVAIVMAPTDTSRSFGIFRLSDPGGTTVLKECQERGFHPHQEPADGGPIYEDCSNVYLNPNLRFEIIDLRY
eukprot:TRINITY_DN21765_c0_g1_i1.p1 TRINITY_DN21765_c0_g1~~TRINITY_DN21765_c0_g1_i1.p1  ORF type:complete len:424 (-),score=56.96 TRINITY_DN21765_c0_g1_i1:206-1477(-)